MREKQTKRDNKGPEWAASYISEDHMAMVFGGVWAVVSFSVLLSGVKRLGGRGVKGGLCVHQKPFSLSNHTQTHTPPSSTMAYHQYDYSSTIDADTLSTV